MASFPGMLGEVFWGKPGAPLPNWREHARPDGDDDDDDERPQTEAEKKYLADALGLTVDELSDDEPDEPDEPTAAAKSFDRQMKSSEDFWKSEGLL